MNIRILKRWFRNYRRKDNFLSKLVNSTYRKTRDFMARSNIRIIARSYHRLKNVERELRGKCTFLTLNDLLTYTNE